MVVCVCNNISEKEICEVSKTDSSPDQVMEDLGVDFQCGSCECVIQDMLSKSGGHRPTVKPMRV